MCPLSLMMSYDHTALHLSSMNGHTATVVALLERGADINAEDKFSFLIRAF